MVPGIADGDEVVFWGGGIYDWFDPLTLVHAVARLRERHPRSVSSSRVVAIRTRRWGRPRWTRRARALADELGLTGTHVFFDEWTDYDERANSLLDADIAVSTHLDHVETRYSFRTRILDYFWAGLPVVATAGDALAELVTERRIAGAAGAGRGRRRPAARARRHARRSRPRVAMRTAARALGQTLPLVDGAGAARRLLRRAPAQPRPPDPGSPRPSPAAAT